MAEIRGIPPRWTRNEVNALLDHGLVKGVDYVIFLSGSEYRAVEGTYSLLKYSGSSYAAVKNQVTGSFSGILTDRILGAMEGYENGVLKQQLSFISGLHSRTLADYIIFSSSGLYYAENSSTGQIEYSGSDASAVAQSVIDASAGAITILFKNGSYTVNSSITPKEASYIVGEGFNTILTAASQMSSILNIKNVRNVHVDNICLNGNGLADKCIDGMHTDWVPVHYITNTKCAGATGSLIDLTGCEDSYINNIFLDGRIVELGDPYSNYGLKIGEPGDNGYLTQGKINVLNLWSGYNKKADVFLKGIWDPTFIECTFVSKYDYAPATFEAIMIVEGATAGSAPMVKITDCWFDGGTNTKPAILCQNYEIRSLEITNSHVFATSGSCISGSVQIGNIEIYGGLLEHLKVGAIAPIISAPQIVQLTIIGTHLFTTQYPDYSKITYYFVQPYAEGYLKIGENETNISGSLNVSGNTALGGNVILNGNNFVSWTDTPGNIKPVLSMQKDGTTYILTSGSDAGNYGGAGTVSLEIQVWSPDGKINLYDSTHGKWLGEFHRDFSKFVYLSSDPNTGSWTNAVNAQGRFWYNTTAKQFRYSDGTHIIPILTGSYIT